MGQFVLITRLIFTCELDYRLYELSKVRGLAGSDLEAGVTEDLVNVVPEFGNRFVLQEFPKFIEIDVATADAVDGRLSSLWSRRRTPNEHENDDCKYVCMITIVKTSKKNNQLLYIIDFFIYTFIYSFTYSFINIYIYFLLRLVKCDTDNHERCVSEIHFRLGRHLLYCSNMTLYNRHYFK